MSGQNPDARASSVSSDSVSPGFFYRVRPYSQENIADPISIQVGRKVKVEDLEIPWSFFMVLHCMRPGEKVWVKAERTEEGLEMSTLRYEGMEEINP